MEFELTDDQQLFRETTPQVPRGHLSPGHRPPHRRGRAAGLSTATGGNGAPSWAGRRCWCRRSTGAETCRATAPADLALVAEEMGRLVSPGPLIPTNVVAAPCPGRAPPASTSTSPTWSAGALLPPGVPGDATRHRPPTGGRGWRGECSTGGRRLRARRPLPTGRSRQGGRPGAGHRAVRSGSGPVRRSLPIHRGLLRFPSDSIDLVRRFACLRFDQVEVAGDAVLGEPGASTPTSSAS